MMYWTRLDRDRPEITVTATSQADLLVDLERHMQAERGFTVATLNLDHVVKMRRDPRFRAAYAAHTHVTADGRPIVWLSRLAAQDVDLVPGSDLIDPLVAAAAARNCPVALIGSTAPNLARAAHALKTRHPNLEIAMEGAPPMGFDPESDTADALIEDIGASGARLCLLALGAPKQELFAVRAARALPRVGFASIGAGLDFIAGGQRRAPRIFRTLGMEWLWRLLGDPRRLAGRYAACLMVLPELLARAFAVRLQRMGRGRT